MNNCQIEDLSVLLKLCKWLSKVLNNFPVMNTLGSRDSPIQSIPGSRWPNKIEILLRQLSLLS